jgi:hypothetical protein
MVITGSRSGHLKHFYSNAAMLKLRRGVNGNMKGSKEKRAKYPLNNNASHPVTGINNCRVLV